MRTDDCDLTMGETELRRGMLAARAGLRTVAAAQLERAAASLPDDPEVWLWLAWVANSPDNTIRCLERVLELSPGHTAANAGLMWARTLARDTGKDSSAVPECANVAEPPASEMSDADTEPLREESTTTTIEPVKAEVETPGWPAETLPEPRTEEPQATSIATSAEPPVETVAATPTQMSETPALEATRRRWTDLVQRDVESSTAADAWPSLAPSPLPAVTADAPTEQEPVAPLRFREPVAAAPVVPVTTNNAGHDSEANLDVDTLTNSFNPPTERTSADGRPLVMVVDDSPTVRKLVSLTLERRGYRVISAFDGVAAIKELGSCRPDLILLDINMPRLDGYRLCKLIKKHEATQAIPVVMLSGKDGMFDKLRGRLVGCSDYITKPFEADALTHKVAKYLTPTSSS